MVNVFKQVQKDVASFKSKHIAPQVLIDSIPEFTKDYQKAIDEYRASPQYKKKLRANVVGYVDTAIYQYLKSTEFKKDMYKYFRAQLPKEMTDGNKQP